MNIVILVIQLVSGALGANIAGDLFKHLSLGPTFNSIVGVIGGGIGGRALHQLAGTAPLSGSSLDIGSIVLSAAGGGVGGGILMAIVGLLRKTFVK